MALETFFDMRCNVGDPCPSETRRMAASRRKDLEKARATQAARRARIEQANERLEQGIREIVEG